MRPLNSNSLLSLRRQRDLRNPLECVTLSGRLVALDGTTCARFLDGERVAAATLTLSHGLLTSRTRPTGPFVSTCAEGLALELADGRVDLAGPVDVVIGSEERPLGRLGALPPDTLQEVCALMDDSEFIRHAQSSLTLRSIRAGDSVSVSGKVSVQVANKHEGAYRTAAHRWVLEPSSSAIPVACVRKPSALPPRLFMLGMAMWLILLTLPMLFGEERSENLPTVKLPPPSPWIPTSAVQAGDDEKPEKTGAGYEMCPDDPPAPKPDRRIYATWQSFPLSLKEHGIDGKLRVLEDSRFTRRGASRDGTHPSIPPCDALPARIEVLDERGKVIQEKTTLPQTDVVAHRFGPHQTLYELRERIMCLASCWCGDGLSFWQVRDGRFTRVETRREQGEVAAVRGVTHGCYEGSRVKRNKEGKLELAIFRTVLVIPGAVEAKERHWWDGTEWRGAIVERKIAW